MTTFTNPHERIEQLMQERDALAAELATAREHFDAVYSRNVYIEASLSSSKTRAQALESALNKARIELSALLDKDYIAQDVITDDMWPEKPNEPDRECMSLAYNAIREALKATRSDGDAE